jgi:hypothetical protein
MTETYRGRLIKRDNIAVGSATGVENTIAGGGGERTSIYGGAKENFKSPCGSSYTCKREIEHYLKTASGGQTTDQTNG